MFCPTVGARALLRFCVESKNNAINDPDTPGEHFFFLFFLFARTLGLIIILL